MSRWCRPTVSGSACSGGDSMRHTPRPGWALSLALGFTAALSFFPAPRGAHVAFAQVLANPYRMVESWAQLPNGRAMGAVGKAAIDRDGRHLWAVIRCEALTDAARFGDECRDSKTDSIYKFGPDGKVVASFGGGMFIW